MSTTDDGQQPKLQHEMDREFWRGRLMVMAQEREQKKERISPAQRSAADKKLRALVRTIAKMAAEADYEASKTQASHPPKGSSS